MSNPNFAGLFDNLRHEVSQAVEKTLSDKEWQYFTEELSERLMDAAEEIFESLTENFDDWADEDSPEVEG